jgi:hypothetical protein
MQSGRLRWAFFVSVLIFSCTGCHVTSERSIVGTYRAEAPCVTITLVVKRDHSFVQSVRTRSGETKELVGKWRIDQWKIDPQPVKTVDFAPFLDFSEDEHGRQGGPGGTGFRPERWPRGILMGPIIVKCPDSGYKIDYVK